jgi:hypothetical protein
METQLVLPFDYAIASAVCKGWRQLDRPSLLSSRLIHKRDHRRIAAKDPIQRERQLGMLLSPTECERIRKTSSRPGKYLCIVLHLIPDKGTANTVKEKPISSPKGAH